MKDLFQANTRLNRQLSLKETRPETLPGAAAKQNAKLMNKSQGEFLERRGLVGELSHMVERKQVEPWFFFRQKRTRIPRLVRNDIPIMAF